MTAPDSPYRERFALTLDHRPVDRCPIDLGGTPQSTIESPATLRALADYLGFTGDPPADYDRFDRRLLEHFDIDFRRAGGMVPFRTGRERTVSATEYYDCYGMHHRFSGMYWEIVGGPLHGAGRDEVAAYDFPTMEQCPPGLLDTWADQARALYEGGPYVIAGEHPVLGVLELACWLCGYDHVMLMMAMDPEWVHLLFGKILAFQKGVIREYYSRLGRCLHLTTSGDDFGSQASLFMSPEMWRAYVEPYFAERIAYTAQFTDAVYMHHSCGAVFDIIPDLVRIGVRILNPIQPRAAGMAPARLKAAHGASITFHGGLDTQEVLPSNNPEVIEAAVAELLAAMAPRASGGYIFAPAHNLQPDVTPAAIACMYAAAHAAGGAD